MVSLLYFQKWVRIFEIEQEDLCFNFGRKRMIRLPKQIQENQLHTCQSLGNGFLPRVETPEAYKDFVKIAELEQFILNTVRQKKKSYYEHFSSSVFPYQYSTKFNGSLLNMYTDKLFNMSMSLPQSTVEWYKKNNITRLAAVGPSGNDEELSSYSPTTQLKASCTIDVPLHIFIW